MKNLFVRRGFSNDFVFDWNTRINEKDFSPPRKAQIEREADLPVRKALKKIHVCNSYNPESAIPVTTVKTEAPTPVFNVRETEPVLAPKIPVLMSSTQQPKTLLMLQESLQATAGSKSQQTSIVSLQVFNPIPTCSCTPLTPQ